MIKTDIGLIGIGVMGENLVLNMESKGFSVSVFDIAREKVERFVLGRAKGKNIFQCLSLQELVISLESPRKIMMMVPAGKPVDE
ncbi:MAG: NADP-dependent phosphogluconate dehydrogenase, partial [Ignavibacteria bacterium]|nr:NADP-dependent phosphogluconate dehydrogenase [Ignavibacteria bacterium]